MWKQFVRKFQRKAPKPDATPDPSCSGSKSEDAAGPSRAAAASVKKMSSAVFPASLVAGIEPLLSFRDVPSGEKQNLFIAKLNLCCVVFDFEDPSRHSAEKDLKRQVLVELVDFAASSTAKFSEPAVAACCAMIAANLFRVFPPNCRRSPGAAAAQGENEDDEPVFDPAWPHLQLVHELLLNFIVSPMVEAKIVKKFVDHSFLLGLLDLFDSDDPRERDCLKTTLHRIYGKFMVHRPFIRKAVSNIFCRFAAETERHNGIAELLEVFGSIISGFALPLKEEHKLFLWRVLMPLHKAKSVGVYMQQLTFCVTQFIDKEPKLAAGVIRGLLRYWPVTSSQKEVMFLGEVEEILESTGTAEFQKIMVPLFHRIGFCLSSSHFQVAERALHLWNNDQVMSLIRPNREVIVPCIFPYLEKNTLTHWNQGVQNVTQNVRKMLAEMDEELFVSCQSNFEEEERRRAAAFETRRSTWERLETAAASAASPPVAGYVPVLVGHLR